MRENGYSRKERFVIRIVISGGHGPETPGKRSADGFREFQFNYPTAEYVDQYLREYEGVSILKVYDKNRDVPLAERTHKANQWKADLYLSIHANAFGFGAWEASNGIETLVHSTSSISEAFKVAKIIQKELISKTGRKDRGVKARPNLFELKNTEMPAVLAECGFMTNKEERELLEQSNYQKQCARAIVNGVADYYNLKKKSIVAPKPKKPNQSTGSLYKVQVGSFGSAENAQDLVNQLKRDGFDSYYALDNGLFKVQSGAFSIYENAKIRVNQLKEKGYKDAWITQK